MGMFDKVKGWLNIGGPKVSIVEVEQPISGSVGTVTGKFRITTTRAAKITKCTQKFFVVETKGTGDEKTEETLTLAEVQSDLNLEFADATTQEVPIVIAYNTTGMMDKLAGKGGMLGAIGKVGQFASKLGEKGIKDYFVEVTCDVVGTPLDPSDNMPLRAALDN